ncbi:MAG: hypothetical protein ACK5KO_10430 [Arachnia sp.]
MEQLVQFATEIDPAVYAAVGAPLAVAAASRIRPAILWLCIICPWFYVCKH